MSSSFADILTVIDRVSETLRQQAGRHYRSGEEGRGRRNERLAEKFEALKKKQQALEKEFKKLVDQSMKL